MGSIFGNAVGKSEVDLATEVNSRLQAVLEDTLYKNITLKVCIYHSLIEMCFLDFLLIPFFGSKMAKVSMGISCRKIQS